MWLVLVGMGFPPSVLPFVLLAGAVVVDLCVTYRVPGWLAGLLTTGVVYGVGFGQDAAGLLPPWNWWSACGWPSASPCCGRRWTCSSAAPGWPAGGRPRNPQRRRHPRRSDPPVGGGGLGRVTYCSNRDTKGNYLTRWRLIRTPWFGIYLHPHINPQLSANAARITPGRSSPSSFVVASSAA